MWDHILHMSASQRITQLLCLNSNCKQTQIFQDLIHICQSDYYTLVYTKISRHESLTIPYYIVCKLTDHTNGCLGSNFSRHNCLRISCWQTSVSQRIAQLLCINSNYKQTQISQNLIFIYVNESKDYTLALYIYILYIYI